MKAFLDSLSDSPRYEWTVSILVGVVTFIFLFFLGRLAFSATNDNPGNCTMQSATRDAQGLVKVYRCKE